MRDELRKVLKTRIQFALDAFADQLVDMLVERWDQQLNQLELAFDAATSAFESDLSVTDGAARRHDVRDATRGTRRVAQRRSHARSEAPDHEGSASGSRKVEGEERDAAAAANRSAPAADRGVSSNPALQQGKDLPPSTSSSTRICGCAAKGRHRKGCSMPNVSTSPASGPPPAAITSSPATSSISRSPAQAPRSVQAPGRTAQAVGANAGDLNSQRAKRFAEIEASKLRREAAERDRGERARAFVRKDGVKPTRAPAAVDPLSADVEAEADEPDLPASVRASFQF